MCQEAWMQSSGFPREIQSTIQDLPFSEDKLFSAKIKEALHSLKGSRMTLLSLVIYNLRPTPLAT
ncbi:hypothetical protein UY3_11375 [Chelonia mydas]|uniref:Uncharacterized protein n=1 Tax=Chelonia mydas TaxID=8469 RepID=M7B0S8_CHEMY|nr:hypothetical protein UY3_11375 [Chelonia mydas]